MKHCAECGTEMPDDASFCPECGVRSDGLGDLPTPLPPPPPPPNEGPVLKPGDRFAERYEIIEKIGEGGMGVVYKATDTEGGDETIALKLIRTDRLAGERAVKRLIDEGLTTRKIRHDNIISVYDVARSDGQPYITMEFVEGQSLRAWHREMVQKREDVPLRVAARIMAEILDGLKVAHDKGVIHRDLSPENIILTTEPSDKVAPLKILDFGIALAGNVAMESGTTSALGKPRYMAPEQITNADTAGPAADLYSLSVMFYELLVDVLPQGHWQPPSGGRSDVPDAIDTLIERGLSNRPASRPQSAEAYRKKLVAAVNIGPGRGTGKKIITDVVDKEAVDTVRKALPNLPWRKILIWGGGAFGALVMLSGLAQMLGGSGGGNPPDDPCAGLSGVAYQNCMGFDDGGGGSNPPPPPRQPTYADLSGTWIDDDGYRSQMRVDAAGNISGAANVDGVPVNFSGSFSGRNVYLSMAAYGQLIGEASGRWDGACHIQLRSQLIDGSTDSGQMHINHQPGAPCP